jgi:hypothetical protein
VPAFSFDPIADATAVVSLIIVLVEHYRRSKKDFNRDFYYDYGALVLVTALELTH